MTNHDEAAGSSGIGDMGGSAHHGGEPTAYTGHGPSAGPLGEAQVTLRTPAELADALPYLLGYRPEDSIVLVALHDRDRRGRFGGRARLGIPAHPGDWSSVAQQLAHGLVTGSRRRGARPESMVAYLVQEPATGEAGRDVMERLRPLAQALRTACGSLDVPVVEALCISDGHFWSYCCPSPGCCPPEGRPMGLPGTSVMAAAAAYAGLQVRGTLKEFRARLSPWETAAALDQEAALDAASLALVPRILDDGYREDVAAETLGLAGRVMARLAAAPPVSGTRPADLRDDELLGHDEAAALILGLQDRTTRDRAAEWMEGTEAAAALRLWRALARRCVGSYGEHAAAPLTLAGWVAWSTGDELEAREALAMALGADRDYLFARLLHQACNEGLDPESVRRCLRAERAGRTGEATAAARADGMALPRGSACVADQEHLYGDGRPAPAEDADDSPDVRQVADPGDESSPGEWPMAVTGDESLPGKCPVPAATGEPMPERRGPAAQGVEPLPDTGPTPFAPVAAPSGSGQAQPSAQPTPTPATLRRHRKVRPLSGGSRPTRRSLRTVDAHHRRPVDPPATGEKSRRTAGGATSPSRGRRGSGRSTGEKDT
ncbi:DUF4192 family protein [Streptomyces yaanensis]|uniref:DUF4192 family protein n=1 Tax=Streptomyces yaanensis TaxID=1142239 RepID=A0ABV7SI02_9ACTN|nr:DUF4192 family protein [Streptomyces sp. CGMCC 4.7035]WNB98267.1 DUF4192 family protein [Streptomyces sp. CGMCC 4.7035]